MAGEPFNPWQAGEPFSRDQYNNDHATAIRQVVAEHPLMVDVVGDTATIRGVFPEDGTFHVLRECFGETKIFAINKNLKELLDKVIKVGDICYEVTVPTEEELEDYDTCNVCVEFDPEVSFVNCCECTDLKEVTIKNCDDESVEIFNISAPGMEVGKVLIIEGACWEITGIAEIADCDEVVAPIFLEDKDVFDNCNVCLAVEVCDNIGCGGSQVSSGATEEDALASAVASAGGRGLSVCGCTVVEGTHYVCWDYCCPEGAKKVTTYRYECENGDLVEIEDETFCVVDDDECDEECP